MPRPRISRAQVEQALGGIVAAGMAPAAIVIEGGRLTVQIGPAAGEAGRAAEVPCPDPVRAEIDRRLAP